MPRILAFVGCFSIGSSALAAALPSEVIDLSGWKLTLPEETSHPGNPDEIGPAELKEYSHPRFFFLNETQDGIVFRAPCGGATTKGSRYPRCELREMSGTDRAEWSTDDAGKRELSVRLAVAKTPPVKPHVVCAQIHGGEDDLLMIRLEGKKLTIERNDLEEIVIDRDYRLGTPFDLRIAVEAGVVEVWYNGGSKLRWKVSHDGCYFKVGCYTQSNVERGDEAESYGEVVVYSLRTTTR